jgi:nucleoside-diphosphate-sugar epimerase
VTGASGYIASWIVSELLDLGYTVRGTVRDRTREDKVAHLKDLDANKPGRLDLVEADLLKPGSFDAAAEGCTVIYHCASPFLIGKVKDPQRQLVDPAVQGTRTVLEAASRSASVRRVVLTASVVSMYGDPADVIEDGGTLQENHWNRSSSLEHQPYNFSKLEAEKLAWTMAGQQQQWDLVSVHPAFVLGPSLSTRSDGASASLFMDMLKGTYKSGMPDLQFGVVDVRDIAHLHVLAGTKPEAHGRYVGVGGERRMLDVATDIEKAFPGAFALPKRAMPTPMLYMAGPFLGFTWKWIRRTVGQYISFNAQRSVDELGMAYRPMEETFTEHTEQLVRDSLVS